MSRLVVTILSGMLLAAGVMLPVPPAGDPVAANVEAVEVERFGIGPYAHCPWALSDGMRSTAYIAVAPNPTGLGLSFVENGEVGSPLTGDPVAGEAGAVAKIVNPRPVGVSSAFAEFYGGEGVVGVVAVGEDILAGDVCPAVNSPTWHLPGGSTLDGEKLVLRLFNPFSADARVDLWALSELGTEADDRLEALTVPARRTRIVMIKEILDGRESLAIIVRPSAGSVIPTMSLEWDTDSAVWAGAAPSRGWEFPVAGVAGLDSTLVLTNEASLPVNFLVETFAEDASPGTPFGGVIEGPGQVRIPLSEPAASGIGLRVTGDGPFGAAVVGRSATAVAVTPGLPTNGDAWLVPGPGAEGSGARLHLLNTGVREVLVSYTVLDSSGESGLSDLVAVPPTSLRAVSLPVRGTDAVAVSGDGPLTVGWWAEAGGKVVFGGGLPRD